MFKIILEILKKPTLLAQSALLKSSFVVKVVLLITAIASIPAMVSTYQLTQEVANEISLLEKELPNFSTENGIIVGDADAKTSHAWQAEHIYFLYDIENKLNQTTKEQLSDQHLVTFLLTKTNYRVTINSVEAVSLDSNAHLITKEIVTRNLKDLTQATKIVSYVSPLISFVITLFVVVFQNLLISIFAQFIFLIQNKLVRFKHLSRVSLFGSIVPYLILTTLKLFGISLPFEQAFLVGYVLIFQHNVMRSILKSR